MAYEKPLPTITDLNRPFWEGCRDGKLVLQRCAECGNVRYPIREICPKCLSEAYRWEQMSGRGEVMSRLIFHQVYHQAFAEDVPYNVVLVRLEEGARMFSNVVGVENEQIRVGDRVQVVFDPVTDEVTIPRFRPVA